MPAFDRVEVQKDGFDKCANAVTVQVEPLQEKWKKYFSITINRTEISRTL